ncbi:hypothetical protein [Alkalicoccus chagannorensis]|uniref:hypothetical protein n=1 Tax=Alkalicoccus chagannorensis TaxID=427072 RepID=UPI0005584E6B|nr:hypothetical protein [Alkalicoccus chagannorensis]
MQTLTVEKTTHVLNKLNIAFTDGAVKSWVLRDQLTARPKPYSNIRDSKFNFTIDVESLINLLRYKGFHDNEITNALPIGIEI